MQASYPQYIFFRNSMLFLLLLLALLPGTAYVEEEIASEYGFTINGVVSHLVNEKYSLDAMIEYNFSPAVLDAIESGVPVTVELEIEAYQPRDWLWDDVRASLDQRYRIEFHALTQQYLVTNLNSQVQSSYPTQMHALSAMGVVTGLQFPDGQFLESDQEYMARIRASLVVNELPSLMRPLAYISPEWHLISEWYLWQLQ